MEKAGFALEGIMRSTGIKNGKVLDVALYSLIRDIEPYPVRRLDQEEIPSEPALTIRNVPAG